ncbi:hypothetical protein [Crenalkalicoccus roseus]|uniref:hypothetical protein n=1 Tax=Crenalkalicoccus roseus TaxID=1485588 RepID=UPI00107FF2C7|nr:hypothetical protein [Crenalkalicoccus roseus]
MAAARALGTPLPTLREAVVLARPQAAAAGGEAEAEGAPPAPEGEAMPFEEREAAIAALAALPRRDYEVRWAAEAMRLGLTCAPLDWEVAAQRARWRAEEAAEVRRRPEPAPGEVVWPAGFAPRPDGLYADTGDDAPPRWLAAPFEVLGEARDAAGMGWGLFLRWRDRATADCTSGPCRRAC